MKTEGLHMGLPAETLHEVNALGERLPRKRVVLKLHEHIVHLAGAGIPPSLESLTRSGALCLIGWMLFIVFCF